MKIVVLDGYTLNPGDISWKAIEELGELVVYERTAEDQIVQRAAGAEVVLTNKTPISADVLQQLPNLKFISVLATGYNIIDTAAAAQLGITVSNVPGYSTASVAQLVFALILEFTHRVQKHSDAVFADRWVTSKDFSFWDYPLTELEGKTMGIIGFGDIGKRVADIAQAFGMNIIAHSRTETDQTHRLRFNWVSLDTVFAEADVLSLHCPLTPQTQGIVNRERLATMKKTAVLINTSRGPLVVEEDLAWALNEGIIAGAGLDVLSAEPPSPSNPLLTASNCLITPHIAWASTEARIRLMQKTAENIKSFVNGKPINKVL